MKNYDTWKLNHGQDEIKSCDCEYCGEEIMVGDECFKSENGTYCTKECFVDHMMEDLNGREGIAE